MGVQVKICGLKTRPSLEASITGGADFVGFVMVEQSPRHIATDDIQPLLEACRGRTKSVILLCDPDDEAVDLATSFRPDYLQLHGQETVERVAAIKARSGLSIIKAFGVADAHDLDVAKRQTGVADIVLLDAKPPKGSQITGGHGVTFDWDLLTGDKRPTFDFMLSGGLTPENVARAIDRTQPSAVDVSSGVESSRGVKSEALISAFLKAAKSK